VRHYDLKTIDAWMAIVHCFTCLIYLSQESKEQWCRRCRGCSAWSVCDVKSSKIMAVW